MKATRPISVASVYSKHQAINLSNLKLRYPTITNTVASLLENVSTRFSCCHVNPRLGLGAATDRRGDNGIVSLFDPSFPGRDLNLVGFE